MAKNWAPEIDEITKDFVSSFGHLSSEQLNFKPNNKVWSIAQNIEHLIIINESYFPLFDKLNAGKFSTPLLGRIKWFANFIGNSILKSVDPENLKKVKTFPSWQPSKSEIDSDIVEQFANHQEELKVKLEKCGKSVDSGIIIHSPVNTKIVYSLEKAIEIIVTHERRHFNQASKIVNEM